MSVQGLACILKNKYHYSFHSDVLSFQSYLLHFLVSIFSKNFNLSTNPKINKQINIFK